jgi:hypothetical protein
VRTTANAVAKVNAWKLILFIVKLHSSFHRPYIGPKINSCKMQY